MNELNLDAYLIQPFVFCNRIFIYFNDLFIHKNKNDYIYMHASSTEDILMTIYVD